MVSAETKYGLTGKQLELYDFIKSYISINRISPSIDEMAGHLKLRSKSGVHRLVTALEERGHIKRLPNRGRSIELVSDRLTGDDYEKIIWNAAKLKAVHDLIHAVRMNFRGEDWDREMLEALDAYDNS